jgi:hypothetical protein
MAADVIETNPPRGFLVAANHGQLLEKLKAAPQTQRLMSMTRAAEPETYSLSDQPLPRPRRPHRATR